MGGEVVAPGLIPRVGVRFGDVRPQRCRGDEPLPQNPRLSGVGFFFQIRFERRGADATAGRRATRSLGGSESHHVAVGHDGPVDREVTARLRQRHRAANRHRFCQHPAYVERGVAHVARGVAVVDQQGLVGHLQEADVATRGRVVEPQRPVVGQREQFHPLDARGRGRRERGGERLRPGDGLRRIERDVIRQRRGGEVVTPGLIPGVGVFFRNVRPQRRRGDESLSQNPRLSGVGLFFKIRFERGGADAAGGGRAARSLGGSERRNVTQRIQRQLRLD